MNKISTYRLLLVAASFLLITFSCNIINPSEQIPSYLEVKTFSLQTDYATQGSSSSKFTDVWVTVDGQAEGAYEMPAKFPLLFSGTHRVQLTPGVLLNGISASRAPYAVVNPLDTTMNLVAGSVITLSPTTTYKSSVHFPQKEDFEGSSITFTREHPYPSSEDTTLTPTSGNDGMEGKYGAAFLDSNRPLLDVASTDSFLLPGNNFPCYVEMNYKCNNEFTVGTIANTQSGVVLSDIVTVRATDIWKKIYVNLTPTVSGTNYATGWKIYLRAQLAAGQTNAYIYFDNIKVIY